MTTISKDVGRGDVLIHRGSDEKFGCKWEENANDGRGYKPKDLSKWTAEMTLEINDKVVYRQDCLTTSDGYAIAYIKGATFLDSSWNDKTYGDWKIIGFGPNGERELLAWGAYEMA